ncbi:MAG: TIGR03619 family F420-dependent LLM class oxidoreductase [Actinomycetota bacterium]|jgi:probable F420-dependent oxidoreductase|nr:TIGR03619 family F420-dependent LLM class oxidoreductase [Actinomycetota bacterium]
MVFGIQLPVQSQSTIYAEPWEAGAGPVELAQVARASEEAGFFYVGVCDHTAIPERLAGAMSTTWYDTVATLGWLAGITERIHLLSHIYVVALRHPLRAAKEFATLDALSGGRIICGVGAGHVPEEFDLLGVPFTERGPATDEAVAGLAAGLADEFPVLRGPRWPAAGVGLRPRPARTPRPPIWVGGSSPAALRRTARFADGWLPQTVGPNAGLVARLRELRDEVRPGVPLDIGAIAGPVHVGDPPAGLHLPRGTVAGGPDRLAEFFSAFAEAGVGQVQVRFPARSVTELCDQIAAFGVEVIAPGAT